MLAQNYDPSTDEIPETLAHLKRAGTSPADVEIRQIVARPFLLLSSIMISFYSCWLLLSAPVRPNLLKESNRGGKHTRQESQLEMERLKAKYCWCSHENTVNAHTKILLMLTWKYFWCSHENTVGAHMESCVWKCDREEEDARLGEKREEGAAIVFWHFTMSLQTVSLHSINSADPYKWSNWPTPSNSPESLARQAALRCPDSWPW